MSNWAHNNQSRRVKIDPPPRITMNNQSGNNEGQEVEQQGQNVPQRADNNAFRSLRDPINPPSTSTHKPSSHIVVPQHNYVLRPQILSHLPSRWCVQCIQSI